MADLEWQEFNPSDALPDGLQEIIDGLGAAVDAIKTALAAVKAVFQVLKALTIPRLDVLKAALESIVNSINQLVESLEEAGVYSIVYVPTGFKSAVTPTTWLANLMGSMTDQGDVNRPEFATPQLQAGCIIMAVGLDYNALLEQIKALLKGILKPFEYRQLSCVTENRDEDGRLKFPPFKLDKTCIRENYTVNQFRGKGTDPDWLRRRVLSDMIPPFKRLAAVLRKCLGLFVFGLGLDDIIEQYIAFLEAKIAALDALAAEFDAILALFEALNQINGISILFFEGTYSTAELQAAVLAVGPPPGSTKDILVTTGLSPEQYAANLSAIGLTVEDLEQPLASLPVTQAQLETAFGVSEGSFSITPPQAAVGAMLLVGGGPTATIDLLRGLFGA